MKFIFVTHGNQIIRTSLFHIFLACKSFNNLTVNCMKMWNKLLINIRTEKRIKPFKRLLYKHRLDTYEI